MRKKKASRRNILSGLLVIATVIGVVCFLLSPWPLKHYFTQVLIRSESKAAELTQKQKIILSQKRRQLPLSVPILLYHYVENVTDLRDTIRQSLNIPPQIFQEQILTLLSHGYHPIVINDLNTYFAGETDLPPKPVILTFDDGYADFYTDVLPILRTFHVPGVLYMVSQYRDSTKNYLTTGQLLEISRSALVEIAAHSQHHPNLNSLDAQTAYREILQSKHELEQLIGRPVNDFAYPYGAYSDAIVKMVEQAGYQTAAGVDPGTQQLYSLRFTLKRIRPGRNTGEALIELISRP